MPNTAHNKLVKDQTANITYPKILYVRTNSFTAIEHPMLEPINTQIANNNARPIKLSATSKNRLTGQYFILPNSVIRTD
jgi:hypothetical protein